MMLQILNGKLDNDFSNPLGLLSDCHRRIERFLEQLLRVAQVAGGRSLSPQEREALTVALRYFSKAAPLHTADEETSLFPRVRQAAEAGNETAQEVLDVMEQLETGHGAAEARHAHIDALGRRWLADDCLAPSEVAELTVEIGALRSFYAEHIAIEDTRLFPLAGVVLASNAQEQIGREMATRRGLDFDNLPAASRCAERRKEPAHNEA